MTESGSQKRFRGTDRVSMELNRGQLQHSSESMRVSRKRGKVPFFPFAEKAMSQRTLIRRLEKNPTIRWFGNLVRTSVMATQRVVTFLVSVSRSHLSLCRVAMTSVVRKVAKAPYQHNNDTVQTRNTTIMSEKGHKTISECTTAIAYTNLISQANFMEII